MLRAFVRAFTLGLWLLAAYALLRGTCGCGGGDCPLGPCPPPSVSEHRGPPAPGGYDVCAVDGREIGPAPLAGGCWP